MHSRHGWFWALVVIGAAGAIIPSVSSAQAPWTVTVTPTLNPLPVGFCAAVQLTVVDASGKEAPRNPLRFRVTMADFDMAVSGASVVGRRIDSTHFEVCACQGGSAGGKATVTATYPAQAIGEGARVAGVAVQKTATFEISEPKGSVNPPACLTAAPAPGAPLSLASTGAALYEPGPVTVTLGLSAQGLWYEPGPVTTTLGLNAQGLWYEPGPVRISLSLSATGTWSEPLREIPTPQPVPKRP